MSVGREILDGLASLAAARDSSSYLARAIASAAPHSIARNADGCACLLIRTGDAVSAIPMRLAGIEASFNVSCEVSSAGGSPRAEAVNIITCLSRDRNQETHFAFAAEGLLRSLQNPPSTEDLVSAIAGFADLFREMRLPQQRSLSGLVGELCCILFAPDVARSIRSWRQGIAEPFDFAAGRLRLDAKASSTRTRLHSISFDQANPTGDTIALFASLVVEQAGGGVSFAHLLERIEDGLGGDTSLYSHLRLTVARTLGDSLAAALDCRFDLATARGTLRLFKASDVPAIRPPLPAGIQSVRFNSNFDVSAPVSRVEAIRGLSALESAIVPEGGG